MTFNDFTAKVDFLKKTQISSNNGMDAFFASIYIYSINTAQMLTKNA